MGTGLGGVGIGQWHWQCATRRMGCKGVGNGLGQRGWGKKSVGKRVEDGVRK
jgi:hypothetical protein